MAFYPQQSYGQEEPSSFGLPPNENGLSYPDIPEPESIEKFRELPDGSALFVVEGTAEGDELSADNGDFYGNLAEHLDDTVLDTIAAELIEDIEADIESRQDWESSVKTIIKYLGWKIEEYKDKMCHAYDNTLSITLMNILALLKSELFPPKGPARGEVLGYPTEETIEQAGRVAIFINYFLTVLDKPYYPDKERLILYVCLLGSAFTKIVMDSSTGKPSARLVKPQDLIVNNECTSILESNRITHALKLTKKEVLLKERDGIFIKGTVKNHEDDSEEYSRVNREIKKMEGVSQSRQKNKNIFDFYECHVEMSPKKLKDNYFPEDEEIDDDDNIPRPYIIEVCKDTKKVASIKRNWDEQDSKFKRIECFVHYYFLPNLGMYSLGLGHLQGSNAVVLTNMLRQSLDAASFGNFPGGFIDDTAQPENNNFSIMPGVFVPIKTDGRAISQIFQSLPFREASPISIQLRQELKGDTASLGGAAQQAEPMGASDAPVGTTLAQIEVNDRLPSNILKSLISSLNYELQLIKGLFAKYLPDGPYPFNVPGNNYQIMRQDFNDSANIIPVADPNLSTKSQRIIINEILIRVARENPGVVDLREAVRRLFKSMNVDDIDSLLPKPQEVQPADPITENMALMTGKGAKAALEQDHASHMIVHAPILQALSQDPTKQAELAVAKAHLAEHQAMQYLIQIQQSMGQQMPDPQALQNPQVQNQIAMMAAQATQQMQQEQQAQNPPPLDPNAVMLQDIEQRREASHLKFKEAELRAETESFKVQTQFEGEKLKMEVEQKLAREKNETDLTVAKMKLKDSLE